MKISSFRRRACALAAATVAVGTIGFVTASDASADVALFPNTMNYKGCKAFFQPKDFNQFNKHKGYATTIVNEYDLSGPSGCSFETYVTYEYWDTKAKKNKTSADKGVFPKPTKGVFGLNGPAGSDGVRLRKGSTVTICRVDFDDCKLFTSKLTT